MKYPYTIIEPAALHRFRQLFSQVATRIDDTLEENLLSILNSSTAELFVVEESGELVAAAIANLYQKAGYREARLDDVVVDEACRGKGYARQLVSEAIEWAQAQGAASVELTSSADRIAANHLYRSMGFVLRETNVYKLKFT